MLPDASLARLIVLFFSGIAVAQLYRYVRAGILVSHPRRKWEDRFERIEFFLSVLNVSVVAGLLAGITVHARVTDVFTAGTVLIGAMAIGVMLAFAHALFPRLSAENRARAVVAATFGGGNRGYVLLLLLLGMLPLGEERLASIVATYFLVDFGNFIFFLTYFSFLFRPKHLAGHKGSQTGANVNKAKRNVRRSYLLVMPASAVCFVLGVSFSVISPIEPELPKIRDWLSILLLFLATFNMFVALGGTHRYDMPRFLNVLKIFLSMRIVGGLVVGFVAVCLYVFGVGIFGKEGVTISLGAVLIAITVLFYSPPSSLVGDMFAVNGVDRSITDQAKSDAAILNLMFIFVLVAAVAFIALTKWAALTLP